MVRRLARWLDLRPGEGWPVFYSAAYIGLASASFLLARPIRNGLFLAEYGPYRLVYVYIGVPLLLAGFVPAYHATARRVGQRLVSTGSLIVLSAMVLVFWWGFRREWGGWLAAAFYVWVNAYGVIAPVQAWSFANSVFDTRQARRLFGVVGSGASAGAIIGGLLAQLPMGSVDLLLVLAALIGSMAVLVNVAWRVRRHDGPRPPRRRTGPVGSNLVLLWKSPYLRSMALLVVLVAITTQWTAFQFNIVVAERFQSDADRITRFSGAFNLVIALVSVLVQITVTGPLLRRFGLSLTLLLLPALLVMGSSVVVLWPVFWAVLLTNSFDQGLRFSLDRSSFELLYLPVSPEVRTRVKAAIDLVVNRAADGIGGILLGLATQGFAIGALNVAGLGFGLRGLAVMTGVASLAWVAVAWRLRRGYVEAIRESIHQHRIDVSRTTTQVLDRSVTEALASKLQDSNPAEILYALDVFQTQLGGRLHPAVRGLLSHSAVEVRRRALALLDEAADRAAVPLVEGLLRDPDPEARTEALLFLAHHSPMDPLQRIRSIADFPEYSIQAGMIGFLCRPGPLQNVEAAGFMLDNLVDPERGATPESRLEAAKLIGSLPVHFDAQLRSLIQDADVDVQRAAVQAAGRARSAAAVDLLVPRLANARIGGDAADALAAIGEPAVPALGAAIEDETLPIEARRQIPPILARIGTDFAQRALYEHLLVGDVVLRYRSIAALARLQRHRPGSHVDRQAVEMVLAAEITGHYRSYQILGSIQDALSGDETVNNGLKQSIRQERERIFGLLGLLSGDSAVEEAYAALASESATIRANALELLDNVLTPDLRRLVLPLVDPQVSMADRVALANRIVGTPVESREEAAQALMASDDPWLRSCGVYAVGALKLTSLSGELERLTQQGDPLLRETARAAMERLELPPEPVAVAEEPVPAGPETGIFELQDTAGLG